MRRLRPRSIVAQKTKGAWVTASLAVCLLASAAPADSPTDASPRPARVVVIDFQVDIPGKAGLGPQVADVLTAQLSLWQAPVLIERKDLTVALTENRLTVSGFLPERLATQTGQLVRADLLIMGKVFKVNETVMIVTKVASVETGRMVGLLSKVDSSELLTEALASVAAKLRGVLEQEADSLLPAGVNLPDPVAPLRQAMEAKRIPRMAIVITGKPDTVEQPHEQIGVALCEFLADCGIAAASVGRDQLGNWVAGSAEAQAAAWPAVFDDVDMVVIVDLQTESAEPADGLSSAVGRIALRVVHREGRTVLADRETQSAVGFTADSASRTALHKAARRLAIRLVSHLAETLPEASRVKPNTHHRSDSVADEPTGSDP